MILGCKISTKMIYKQIINQKPFLDVIDKIIDTFPVAFEAGSGTDIIQI